MSSQECPKIAETARRIMCFRPKCLNKKEEMFLNFRVSTRGAIRQAPSVITWCLVLQNLRAWGCSDPSQLIIEHNNQVGRSSQLIGGKAYAVRMILNQMPHSVLSLVMEHVGALGWQNSVFTDDCFANKRVYPGSVFKHPKISWKVTERSMRLHILMTINDHMGKAEWSRRKVGKKDFEEGAELAAVAEAVFEEAKSKLGLDEADVQQGFLDVISSCSDQQLQLEVYGIAEEKPAELRAERISVIKALLMKREMSGISRGPSDVALASNLEDEAFSIMQKSIEYDVKAMVLYTKKYETYTNAMYWAKLAWKRQQRADCISAAKSLITSSCRILAFKDNADAIKGYLKYVKDLVTKPSLGLSENKLAPSPPV